MTFIRQFTKIAAELPSRLRQLWAPMFQKVVHWYQGPSAVTNAEGPPLNSSDLVLRYCVHDGTKIYIFKARRAPDGTFKIYLVDTPLQGRRHLYSDPDGYFICWSAPIRTFSKVIEVHSQWAEATERYINDGITF